MGCCDTVYHIGDCIDSIRHAVDAMQYKINRLETENASLRNEHFKDRELLRQKREIEMLQREARRGFRMTEYEVDLIDKWICKHEESHEDNGCGGGRYTYEFTPTTIGCIGVVKCSCGEEFCFRSLD